MALHLKPFAEQPDEQSGKACATRPGAEASGTEEGDVAERAHAKIVGNVANQLWHSDSSFQRPRAKYSMLCAVVVPPEGGETEFADLRAAHDALPDWRKRQVDDLTAVHYALHATQRQFVYQHRWRVGDLVIWDNTATVHRGRYYDFSQRRELRRATTEEVTPSPEAQALAGA